ncbi:MAG: DUF1207 domain-containing protein [Nitrospirota bacterium]
MTQPLASLAIDSAVPFTTHRVLRKWTKVIVFLLCLFLGWMTNAMAVEDSYIAGYAAAVLQHEFNATNASLIVKDGVVTVYADSLATLDRTKVQTALENIPGVQRVEILEGVAAEEIPKTVPSDAITQTIPKPESKFLPKGLLFAPLHADPRWPQFSVAYRHISEGSEPSKTGSANFGETFAIYRDAAPFDGQWEIAFQGGLFSEFNLGASSKDLVNADYTAGLLASYRTGSLSGFLRVHHQSSHLGDEFILNNQPNRINLSYEEIDLKLSYELFDWFRVYGGGGILVDRDPKTLGRGTSQFGTELTSPWTLLSGKIRPVAYADFQVNERSNWTLNRSVMAGLQFENARIGDRKLQLLMEYYKGASPNGQFYSQQTQWIGIGLHLYY